jgi:hypothetical protein
MDRLCVEFIDSDINSAITWYLMSAYSTQKMDSPILSASRVERLHRTILDNWDDIKHPHKDLVDTNDFILGEHTGEFPPKIEIAIIRLMESYLGKKFKME